ncbi:MAG: M16 family metallopeptidase [Prochlorotrichaceae cyanobacterium]|jgi:predicted Zn-dependent peptidase
MFEPTGLEVLQFSNNLNVIYQPLPTEVVVADVWVSAGAAIEPAESNGIAHLLEHMIFKGTPQLAPGMFDRLIENQGGVTNAATSYDYTHFVVATGAEQFQPCLKALAHILLEASLCPLELEGERQVVLAEINQMLDNPGALSWQYFNEQLYPAHPYGRSILGTPEQVQDHSNHDLKAFHRCHYQPENITIVVAGGIEKPQCLHHIQQAFEVFPSPLDRANLADLSPANVLKEPFPIKAQRSERQLPYLDQTSLMLGWATPAIDHLQEICGLEVLSVILSGGRLSSLVQILREQRQVVQDVCSELELRKAASRFTIIAWLEESYVTMVEALILHELRRIREQGPSAREMERAKRLLLNNITFSLETPLQIAQLYGFYNILHNPYVPLQYPRQVQQLTAKDLQDIAQAYLTEENYVVTIVRPS